MKMRILLALLSGAFWLLAYADARCDDSLPGIVFVSDDIFGPKYIVPGIRWPGTSHWRDGYIYHRSTSSLPLERTTTPTRPGRNLYTLVPAVPDGKLTRITHLTDGEVFDPEPSYDGRRILFSMRRDGEDWFNLYEIGADGVGLLQLTDGPFNDVSGVYLPDGRIVFVSDRAGYLEEYHEERTETLWIMNGDGSNIQQLTFNPGTVFDPAVLRDGRILFSLWDTFMLNIPPADKHETYLMTVRPDGAEENHFFGAGRYRFFDRERHSGIAYTQAGEMPDGTILVQTEMGPSTLDPSRGMTPIEALWPVFPGTTSVQFGGATHRVHLSPTGSRSTPYPLPDGRFLFSGTLPGARDLGIYVADPKTRLTELVFNNPTTSEFDPRPILLERPRPRVLPPKGDFAGTQDRVAVTGRARFTVLSCRRSDDPQQEEVLHRARYLRVVEVLPTAVTTSSHTSLATRILGVAPLLRDGSAYFEAPANTPLYLEPLDAAGRRLQFEWDRPETSVPVGSRQILMEMSYITAAPGEMKSCSGCHAPQDEAARQPGYVAALALRHQPVQIQRDATDLMYRRNEPDEYRCHARIGEAPKYRPWLASPNADLRRRACELLMVIEDGAWEDAPAIAALLADESVAVRRAAALALARLGTVDQAPALVDALSDRDWQVRFHATAALESITACRPDLSVGEEAVQAFYAELVRDGGLAQLKEAIYRGPAALGLHAEQSDADLALRWFEAVGRFGPMAPESARRFVHEALDQPLPPPVTFQPRAGKRHALEGQPPEMAAIRAAGRMRDAASIPLLVPWLQRHEYHDHVTEIAVALGRIGTSEAVAALWEAARRDAPNRAPFQARYLQRGPRPEEYALLRGLILAAAKPAMDDIPLIIGLLPGTFLEKPRYEDRARPESQRVLLGRVLLENAGLRKRAVEFLAGVLCGDPPPKDDPLYQQILKGINLERPFAEHGRKFPVMEQIEPEQALWLLGCLAVDREEVPEEIVVGHLTSENWRERIDATVLLNRFGFGPRAAEVLATEAEKPYSFKEIMSIGKGRFDPNFRDKCYMVMALAHHVEDVERLRGFADPKTRYRDVRYGLAVGLGMRGRTDGIGLLVDVATGDPISVVRRQARASLRAIQESQRIAGNPAPDIRLPKSRSFEAWYPPRGLNWPEPVVESAPDAQTPASENVGNLKQIVAEVLLPDQYRNLNNGNNNAPGATRMIVRRTDRFDSAARLLSARYPQEAEMAFQGLLKSPYPYAHYLALHELPRKGPAGLDAQLISRLESFAKTADTVGFFWTCEVLADRRVDEAIPVLVRYAEMENPPGLHGPVGMGFGYPAAKAASRLAGQLSHPDVKRLLASDNIWLRAGALAGLTEAQAPGLNNLLTELLDQPQPAIIRDHAAVGLSHLTAAKVAME